jgi:hypothetical protein
MEKTLIIIIGNARGGEETWSTMYENLLTPYNADLALCFGETKDKTASLYQKAKYIWEMPEYNNWREYYDNNFAPGWDKAWELYIGTGLFGGVDNNSGSGAIVFAFRDYILKNHLHILNLYDRIILTRSDYYYIAPHPILPLGKVYITEGEDYGGLCDRHHIFDSQYSEQVLGVCDFLCDNNNFEYLKNQYTINPERALLLFFEHNGINNFIERCMRVQFTVASSNDKTRWCEPSSFIPNSTTIRHKYISEYDLAVSNLKKSNSI